ncbi:BamA/TamA family outer membrane protein [Anseongella ginsenosidimutans]|nr:BamA/TamA family outer membrane protein [Anseongella ginsenosidimutans]
MNLKNSSKNNRQRSLIHSFWLTVSKNYPTRRTPKTGNDQLKTTNQKLQTVAFLLCILCFASCSNLKHLPEGEKLYTGAEVQVEGEQLPRKEKKRLEDELSDLTRPLPNSKFLGMRLKLFFYNLAGNPKKEKSPAAFIKKKMGEPPVLYSSVDIEKNRNILVNSLQNQGYFKAESQVDSSVAEKKASLTYTLAPGSRYMISKVGFPADSSALAKAIRADTAETLLKLGEPYDLTTIKAERERIDKYLKEHGFYYFNPDYLIVKADSTQGGSDVELYVRVKENAPRKAREVYRINNIYIYPDYSLQEDTTRLQGDTVFYHGFHIFDPKEKFKTHVFRRTMFFQTGDIYNLEDHNLSLNRLVHLGTFKFVKNQFTEVQPESRHRLDVSYYLTPMPKKSLNAKLSGTSKSNNFVGSEVSVGWLHRNAFRGAEQLQLNLTGGFETQTSGQQSRTGGGSYFLGAEVDLQYPRFITPFYVSSTGAYVPRTRFTGAYELRNRANYYSINSYRFSFGYIWKESSRKEHTLNPVSITFVQPFNTTPLFDSLKRADPTLRNSFDRQFILGANYSFTYTDQLETERRHNFYFQGMLDLSGNIAGLFTGKNSPTDQATIFRTPFSQYIKAEADARSYYKINDGLTWANRLILGAGQPYGNSSSLPFVKQFFIGGSNSLRAFRARSLGPGSYDAETSAENSGEETPGSFFPDQAGDLKLEANTELRFDLVSALKGAIFADAGNIWLMREDPLKPGAAFSSNFYQEIAVGTGLGLRVDLSFFVVRLDVAFPLRKPWLPEGERWVIDQVDFSDKNWRKENLVFNIAIGYPF